jgi:UV DNA damage endonuclease
MIRLGYVGVNTLLKSASKTFRLANYSEEKMLETAKSNLHALKDILVWNKNYEIHVFRITSHLIPFGSSPINLGSWKNELKCLFENIGIFIKENNMRVSMHPGQYTVINSPNPNYYKSALDDLDYHNSVLELMKLDKSHRIILHGGGIYGDKSKSMRILKERVNDLEPRIKDRLALENDDKNFNSEDILNICLLENIPAVFDVFHHQVLPSFFDLSVKQIILEYGKTWKNERQKIHYSNQDPSKKSGSHSTTIDADQFTNFYKTIDDLELDVMLEVKDKQNSILKLRKYLPNIH